MRALRIAAVIVALAEGTASWGCRTEGPSATISADEADAGVPAATAESAEVEGTASTPVVEPSRELWFAAGPGRQAIMARERRDHEAAIRLLDAVLATELSPDERGGAQWLRGLEDLEAERFVAAADRFAEAAKAPALAPLRGRLTALEARARLDGGQPEAALALVRAVSKSQRHDAGLEQTYAVLEADALLRTHDRVAARRAYEAYLSDFPQGDRRLGVTAKLARMLAAEEEDVAAKKRAVELYETLLEQVPLSDYGVEAKETLPGLRKQTGDARSSAQRAAFDRRVALAELDAMLSRRRYTQATKAADQMMRRRGIDAATRCRALYVKGSAIFKKRQRKQARPVFDKAAAACRGKSALTTYEVKSRYQGARGLYAEGKYGKAAEAFTALARDHAKHSYADDAWVLAGESWAEHGDEAQATAAFEAALAVGGDQLDEARRRLLLLAFARGDAKRALALGDGALKRRIAHPAAEAKVHYFRGRALAELGRGDEATEAFVAAVTADPLGYASAQAMSRLHTQGAPAFARGLEALQREAPQTTSLKPGPNARRALLLARLGLGEQAREELEVADVKGWPAIAVLNQAGLYAEGQRTLANLGTTWRRTPPSSAHVPTWKLAHPLPFADLIEDYEHSHGVPDLLAYAVMQTESRFNPGATSWAGARGLIQLMPATAKGLADKAGVTLRDDSLYDPAVNLDLGMRYLANLVARYGGGPGAVALAVPSYNAGAGAVDKWLSERGNWDLDLFIEAIPYGETRKYTQSVVGRWWAYRWLYGTQEAAQRVPLLPVSTPSRAEG